ncbi:lysozyme inhibitor LprI family protein [Methylophaga nitratireducenticrescens]|nr:lysozyme inhibitor LprI family protein [Methylophaga nitratireducenticrescens]
MRILGLFLLCVPATAMAAVDCPDANTTYEIGVCMAEQLEQQEVEMQHYLAEAIARYADDKMIVESIEKAQQSWLSYRQEQCGSIYTIWRDGTIRSIMGLSCSLRMAKLRTHQIWHSYLTYMDNSPSFLPEPEIE